MIETVALAGMVVVLRELTVIIKVFEVPLKFGTPYTPPDDSFASRSDGA